MDETLYLTLSRGQQDILRKALAQCPTCHGRGVVGIPIPVQNHGGIQVPGQPNLALKMTSFQCPRCAPIYEFLLELTGTSFKQKEPADVEIEA